MKKKQKYLEYGAWALIISVFAFTRTLAITQIQRGIHEDEAGMLYDA